MLAMKGLAGLKGPNGEWEWTPHDADWIFPGKLRDDTAVTTNSTCTHFSSAVRVFPSRLQVAGFPC
jgi:hypothetical protein